MARRRKEAAMGRALVTLGFVIKIIQLLGTALGLDVLGGTVMTLITTCFIVGGLAVLAIERMNITGAFALICVVGVIGGILPTNSPKSSLLFMMISFIAYGVMLITMKRPLRITFGVVVIALAVLLALQSFGVVSLAAPLVTAALVFVYCAMGAGLWFK